MDLVFDSGNPPNAAAELTRGGLLGLTAQTAFIPPYSRPAVLLICLTHTYTIQTCTRLQLTSLPSFSQNKLTKQSGTQYVHIKLTISPIAQTTYPSSFRTPQWISCEAKKCVRIMCRGDFWVNAGPFNVALWGECATDVCADLMGWANKAGAPLAGQNPESTAGEQLGPVVLETDGRGAHRSL